MAPRVSVLLPARDAAGTLPGCLASLARQSEPRWECVLVDDGSRDGTAEVARRAAAADGRIRLVAGAGAGLVAALEAGLAHCTAPVVARMDADDLMHRERLAAQLALLDRRPGLDGVGCHVRLFPRRSLGPGYREYERWLGSIGSDEDVAREAFVECPLAHPTPAASPSCATTSAPPDGREARARLAGLHFRATAEPPMALKKSQLYSSLWQSCDELRGGMDASQYKDYVLTLLFMKYVSDKYAGKPGALIEVPQGGGFADMVALKGDKEIGDRINKIIGRLAGANDLEGVIDQADFNDEGKLGSGKETQDRLSKLVAIFDGLAVCSEWHPLEQAEA